MNILIYITAAVLTICLSARANLDPFLFDGFQNLDVGVAPAMECWFMGHKMQPGDMIYMYVFINLLRKVTLKLSSYLSEILNCAFMLFSQIMIGFLFKTRH